MELSYEETMQRIAEFEKNERNKYIEGVKAYGFDEERFLKSPEIFRQRTKDDKKNGKPFNERERTRSGRACNRRTSCLPPPRALFAGHLAALQKLGLRNFLRRKKRLKHTFDAVQFFPAIFSQFS